MSRSTASYGMLLDRGLTLEQLNLAYDIAVLDPEPRTNRKRLTMVLRDVVSEQEAEGKTKKCLTRVWLNPPPEAAEMITWVRQQDVPESARRVLHFGALLATFPFVGAVARVIGQHLQTEGAIEAPALRAEIRRTHGDRPSVEVAARKVYTTFRNLDLISQSGQSLGPGTALADPGPVVVAWLIHSVLLTRQIESVSVPSFRSAPEMLGLLSSAQFSSVYPLLETHSQFGEPVLVPR